MPTVHVVSHTHWDREWYQPAARVRQRLVALVDELLDHPPTPPTGGASFLLDGQTVLLDDYLDVRPERTDDLRKLLQDGALEAGPWFVLADELIPGGEALVRNLLAGRRALETFGVGSPPVLYCPDSFGHPAALPVLAHGFGFELIIVLRGYGGSRWPDGDAALWTGPDGSEVLMFHFSNGGYELAANLPTDPEEAARRWRAIRAELFPRSRLGATLLMNGADHHARQTGLTAALVALVKAATPDEVRGSSLGAFAGSVTESPPTTALPKIRGELRDSYGYVWTLQGTFATRAYQKRRNATLERTIVRDVEPWAALASRLDGETLRPLVNATWRSLLLCHPHDTLCGCSTDEVARAMDARLDETESQAFGLREDVLFDCIGHRREAARSRPDDWQPTVVIRNPAPRPRSGFALLRLTSFVSDVKVGIHPSSAPHPSVKPRRPAVSGIGAIQVLAKVERYELTESPRHYPDADLVQTYEVAAWVPEIPAYGVRCLPHVKRSSKVEIPNAAGVHGDSISNGILTVRVTDEGRISFADHRRHRSIKDLLRWESLDDLGDLYTASLRGPKLEPRYDGSRVVHRGPVRATIETRWMLHAGAERVRVHIRLTVDANSSCARVTVRGHNSASDHRLRLRFDTDVGGPQVFADAAFGPVERKPIAVSAEDAKMEVPPPTAPLHRYVSLFDATRGATLYADGLAEYEADEHGGISVTLLRAVGELSRNDLPERNGHAGWPTPTPEAQCHGPFEAEFALLLHGPRNDEAIDAIEQTADDVLLPITGSTLRSNIGSPNVVEGIALEGDGLAFSCVKESEDGTWLVLRCVNLLEREVSGEWQFGVGVSEARMARLDETPGEPLHFHDHRVDFTAPPRGVVTVLVR